MLAEEGLTGTKTSSTASPTSARLGGARADFVAGLGRKVADLRAAFARVKQLAGDVDPSSVAAREELRRKLHALASAAKMMRFYAMDRALGEGVAMLDRTANDTALADGDLEILAQTIENLPALAWGDDRVRSSNASRTEGAARPTYKTIVVGGSLLAEALIDETDASGETAFACENTTDAQAAYGLVREREPDLVVLDADLPAAAELVESLMGHPLTEAVPIVVVGSFAEPGEAARFVAMGVARTVNRPVSRAALAQICRETLAPERAVDFARSLLGEPTLEQLGERLASELREALVGRADPAVRGRKIPLGEGTEVLGALWGAIARMREVITARSDGSIRFAPGAAFTGPLLGVEPDVAGAERALAPRRGLATEVRLQGRRILVVDDDPAVVQFIADLLRTAGCIVHEAFDGEAALELAYKLTPDLVITDILMPKMDGFSLCRALRRDVALRDTPVIMLSWKEDLLQRVRELGANAAGYVRKESDTLALLARVREALRTRGRIEQRLSEDGEVRGRLDGISIRSLLEIASATRPDARVSVHDASFLYEVELRLGAPVRATRTDASGAFLKGKKALTELLGVSAGRFTVVTSNAPIETELDGNLPSQMAKPVAQARAAMSLLTGSERSTIARVRFDEAALDDYLKATPERARVIARRLVNGAAPRELVMCGGCEPALLDDLLVELAARGFVVALEAAGGSDLLAPAMKAMLTHSDARAAFAPRTPTPSPLPTRACMDDGLAPLCESPVPGPSVDIPTPPAEQIVALGEPTVVDGTVYAEEAPLSIERSVAVPKTKRTWPMVALVAVTGVVAWAVLHVSPGRLQLPKLLNKKLETGATEPMPASVAKVPALASVERAESPALAATPVTTREVASSKERTRSPTKVEPAQEGVDGRARGGSADERGCATDHRRVARVKL